MARLKEVLPGDIEIDVSLDGSDEYVEIYLNLKKITARAIDEVNDY